MGKWPSRILYYILHLAIHHYPSIARIVSIQVTDIRVIFEELDGLELGVKDFRAGLGVNFEGNIDGVEPLIEQVPLSPEASAKEFKRAYPLLSPRLDFSPGASPTTSPLNQFSSFSFSGSNDNGDSTSEAEPVRVSRMTHAKRRASVIQSRMTSTVASVWSRAIGRAHGSVSLATSIRDFSITLPYRGSDLKSTSSVPESPPATGIMHQASIKPLNSKTKPMSFRSVGSFRSMLRSKLSGSTLNTPDGGSELLLSLDGTSHLALHLGFGPRQGLLGEDTLRTSVRLANFNASLDGVEKLHALSRTHEKSQDSSHKSKGTGSFQTLQRVSTLYYTEADHRRLFARSSLYHSRLTTLGSPISFPPSPRLLYPPRLPSPTFPISLPGTIVSPYHSTLSLSSAS